LERQCMCKTPKNDEGKYEWKVGGISILNSVLKSSASDGGTSGDNNATWLVIKSRVGCHISPIADKKPRSVIFAVSIFSENWRPNTVQGWQLRKDPY
jgi:hypothetical protein